MGDRILTDLMAPFPKRWRDPISTLTVLAGPAKGWLMVKRPGAAPFCLRYSDLCNTTRRPPHGPFECVGAKRSTSKWLNLTASSVPAGEV